MLEWFRQWIHDLPSLAWLYVAGNGVIVLACFIIAGMLWHFAREHRPIQYRAGLLLLGSLVAAQGVAHLINIANLSHRPHGLGAWLEWVTGGMALACIAIFWSRIPPLLALLGADDLPEAHRRLLQSNRELINSESRYRLLAETAGEGIWMLDSQGVTTYANQAMREMLRCEHDLLGYRLTDFVFDEDVDAAHHNLLRRLSGIRERHEFRFRRCDATAVYTVVHASPIRDDHGTPIGSLKVITDVSDLVETEHKLEQLNRELEQRVDERTRALEASNIELAQEVMMREYIQQELSASNERLNRYLEELERQNEDVTWLNALSDQLHCCDTHVELVRVLERGCNDFFACEGGALYEWRDDQLALLGTSWGSALEAEWEVHPEVLLAQRQGRLFPDSAEEQNLLPGVRSGRHYVLVAPLQARGRAIGALQLLRTHPFWIGTTALDARLDQLLRALADRTALALSNLMLREKLREQSLSDPLTGLYNRRYMYQQLARLIALWERGGQSFAVILIDVDHFKSFNDRFGHDVGDEVLVAIAGVLQTEVRKSDIACRMGGEEFVVLMTGASIESARERAENLRVAVKSLEVAGAPGERVTTSAGIALYPDHGVDEFALMRAADKALYESKRSGRDRISLALAALE